ncbi:SdrD B-like domain-containing protein [Leucobacter celer]|uniref:SdrD B-like domain-containing protein n=1 Tax=Leucobacter celer TaxID=668625 RepID=UPI0012FB1C0C|nr:SdrD B-like domain-containing protein [Leucobacter celer]
MTLALAFTLTPATVSWAEDPTTDTPSTETPATDTPVSEAPADAPETGGEDAPAPMDAPVPQGDEDAPAPADIDDPDPALPTLALDVRIKSDGTPGWDADSGAGNDSGPNNGVVRVNDTVTYEVEYAVPSGTAENTTFQITFPKGMEITDLPGFCQATGSSIAPATAGEPTIPLTADSIDELSEQTLICNRGTIVSGTDIVDVTVKVLNLAHQGQDLPITAAQIVADGYNGVAIDTANLPNVKASARLMWDISKNGVALDENSGYVSGPADIACPWDSSVVCKITYYSVLFSAPAGGKGAMPAVGDVTFVDDLSPEAMYPSLTSVQHAAMNADPDKYGSRIVFANTDTNYNRPGHKIGSTLVNPLTSVNSVRDSGSISIDQPGPGEPAEFTIANADWSLRTYPSQVSYPTGNALPGNAAYAVSSAFRVYTPVAAIRDFGVESNNSWTLSTYNSFTDLDIRGFDSATDVQTSADQPGANAANLPGGVASPVNWNDYRTTTPIIKLPGGFDKFFMGLPGLEGNVSPTLFAPGNTALGEGPPGGATRMSGGITVAPTQLVTSQLAVTASTPSLPADVSWVGCDAWDSSKLNLATGEFGPGLFNGAMQRVPSSGEGVWISGYNNVPEPKYYADDISEVPDLTVQYSAQVGAAGAASTCGEDMGPWYDDPSQVPGNDPTLATQGVYTAVSRVRAHMVIPPAVEANAATGLGVRASVSIALRVADNGMATGTILPNWASEKRVNFDDLSLSEVIAASGNWWQSSYTPETHSGSPGDRLILAHAQARIDKQVRKGDSGSFSDTPPQTTGGDLVQYRLQPSLTSGAATPGILKDVWVEDCLPDSQIYASASVTPVLVQSTTPGDAKRPACAAGETYIRWVVPQHEVNTVMDPIIMSVNVDPTAEDGVYENTVVVWAEDDASTLEQRSDEAQIQISNIRGVRITKQPLTPVVQVNRAGQATNELNEWSVRFSNRLPGNAPVPNDPDIIDVLPKQGVLGSDFHGSFTFHSAEVTDGNVQGQQVHILYTKNANPSEDPRNARNGATGNITWCDAPAGGAVASGSGTVADCPASASEVTAVRVQRPGPFSTGSAIQFTIRMVGIDNRGGDVYVNRATGFAEGLENAVRSAESPEVAIESSIGDYTWWDFNRDGIQNQWQGAPEQPATGIPVRVTGVDDLGNPVQIDTTTGADGKYVFEQLRSSNEGGYTVTFTRPDGTEFTVKAAGDDRAVDSNADPATGAADAVVLGRDTHDLTIDAGLLPLGGVQINKALTGAGAGEFAASDILKFQVVCTFDPELDGVTPVEVLNQEVILPVNGANAVTSDVMAGLPAFSSCTITETDHGSADAPAAPVTVTVPWNAVEEKSGTVTGSLTNFISAGSVQVSKTLAGDDIAVEAAKDRMFEILATCQIEEANGQGETVLTDVYSGVVKIKGGQTKYLVGDDGEPRLLPLDARCFGEEVNTGGAQASEVDFDSWENSVPVTDGTPEELQVLTISAVNTFENAELTVSKKVEGPGTGGAYDFTLSCTIPGEGENGEVVDGEYVLPEADAKFRLKDGESRTITVPAGVSCQVKETNVPDGAKVTITDSDDTTDGGASDGIVTNLTGTDNTVKVLNTFPPCEGSCLPVTGGQMLGAVGLLGAGLLLVGGALFLLRKRRKEDDATVTPAHG